MRNSEAPFPYLPSDPRFPGAFRIVFGGKGPLDIRGPGRGGD